MRGVKAPVDGLVTFQTLLTLLVQICSPGTFAWIRQKSPTAGNGEATQGPRPNSKSSKSLRSLIPAFTVTVSMDQPSALGPQPSAEGPSISLVKAKRNWRGFDFPM